MISRGWYVVAGAAAAVGIALGGYLAGRATTRAAWDRARLAWADSAGKRLAAADSARRDADAAADAARASLDTALARWRFALAADGPPATDTVRIPSDTQTVVFGQPVWHPGLDQLQLAHERDSVAHACRVLADQAQGYRTACERARAADHAAIDSLQALLRMAAAAPEPPRPAPLGGRLGVWVGPAIAVGAGGHLSAALAIGAGLRIWP